MKEFEELKEELLKRAKEHHACTYQYRRALKAETWDQLMSVIRDNFTWASDARVLTSKLISKYEKRFASYKIYANKSVKGGFILVDGNTRIETTDATKVFALDNAEVVMRGKGWIKAMHHAKITAFDYTYMTLLDDVTAEIHDHCIAFAFHNANITAYDYTKVYAKDLVTIQAYDNVSVYSTHTAICHLHDNATLDKD